MGKITRIKKNCFDENSDIVREKYNKFVSLFEEMFGRLNFPEICIEGRKYQLTDMKFSLFDKKNDNTIEEFIIVEDEKIRAGVGYCYTLLYLYMNTEDGTTALIPKIISVQDFVDEYFDGDKLMDRYEFSKSRYNTIKDYYNFFYNFEAKRL